MGEDTAARDALPVSGIRLRQNFGDTATILYPSAAESHAREARIEIRDPLYSEGQAVLILRPVNLLDLDQLILNADAGSSNNKLKDFAHRSAFGEPIVGS